MTTPGPAAAPARVLDAGARGCGEICPLVRQELRTMGPGEVLAVRSTERGAGTELTGWCRLAGHEFLGTGQEADARVHYIRRKSA